MTPERFRKIRAARGRRQPDLTVIADNFRKSRNVAADEDGYFHDNPLPAGESELSHSTGTDA